MVKKYNERFTQAVVEYLAQFDVLENRTQPEGGGLTSSGIVINNIPDGMLQGLKRWFSDNAIDTGVPLEAAHFSGNSIRIRTGSTNQLLEFAGADSVSHFVDKIYAEKNRAPAEYTMHGESISDTQPTNEVEVKDADLNLSYLKQFNYSSRQIEYGDDFVPALFINSISDDKLGRLKEVLENNGVGYHDLGDFNADGMTAIRIRTASVDSFLALTEATSIHNFIERVAIANTDTMQLPKSVGETARKANGGWQTIEGDDKYAGILKLNSVKRDTVEAIYDVDYLARFQFKNIDTPKGPGIVIHAVDDDQIDYLNRWASERGLTLDPLSENYQEQLGTEGFATRVVTDSIRDIVDRIGVTTTQEFVKKMNVEHENSEEARKGNFARQGDYQYIRKLEDNEIEYLKKAKMQIAPPRYNDPDALGGQDKPSWVERRQIKSLKGDILERFQPDRDEEGRTVFYIDPASSNSTGMPSEFQMKLEQILNDYGVGYDIEQRLNIPPEHAQKEASGRSNIVVVKAESMHEFLAMREALQADIGGNRNAAGG